jgi:ATP-binding cassette subfamily F protein 3
LLVADGRVVAFDGDLDDYKKWAAEYRSRATLGAGRKAQEDAAPAVSRKDEKRLQAEQRQRQAALRKPFEKRLAAIEAELDPLASESKALEAWLASTEAYEEANRERLQVSLRRRAEVAARIGQLEEDWLWAQAELDQALERGS